MTCEIQHWSEIGHLVLACPFCDSGDQMLTADDPSGDGRIVYQVFCQHCGAAGPVSDAFGGALLYWNDSIPNRRCELS